jgi:hypothetical protein
MTTLVLVRVDLEPQRFRSHERDEIALPLPGRGCAQRRGQLIVGLRARRRTGAILQRTRDKNDGVAGYRKLALAALAPQLEDDLAAVADFEGRKPLRSRLTCHVQRHLKPERKLVLGVRRDRLQCGRDENDRNAGLPQTLDNGNHLAPRNILNRTCCTGRVQP